MAVGMIAACAVVAGAASAIPVHPSLTLSRNSGAPGTRVVIAARGCTKPIGGDTLAWHDHYYWVHDLEKRPPMGIWRRIAVHRSSPTVVRGIFVVRGRDHRGRGLLDLFCGSGGNAIATFTVTG